VKKKKVVTEMLLKNQHQFKELVISGYSKLSEGHRGCDMAKSV